MILAIERGEDVRFYAVDLEERPAAFAPPLIFGDEPARLIAMMMHRSLDDLGVSSGELTEAPMPNQRLGDLSIDASYVAAFENGEVFEWSSSMLVDASILDFRIAKKDPDDQCVAFEQILLTRHPFTRDHFLVPLEGGGALAGYGNTVARLLPDGTIAESTALPGLVSAARTSTAIFVLADDLYRASVDPIRFESIAEFPAALTKPEWISAGSRDEVFSFANDGSFARFDGRAWSLIETLHIDGDNVSKGGALWLAPGQSVGFTPAQGTVGRFDGTLHYDMVAGSIGFGAGLLSEKYGPTIIETRFAEIYRYAGDGAWVVVPIPNAPAQVQALTDYRGGLAWVTSTGFFGYETETDDCGSEPVLEASESFEVARLSAGLVVGYVDRNTDWALIYFRPIEK